MTEEKVVNPVPGNVFHFLCSLCGKTPEEHTDDCPGKVFVPHPTSIPITKERRS